MNFSLKYFCFLLLLLFTLLGFAQTVITTKNVYDTNEPIKIRYSNFKGTSGDWISLAQRGSEAEDYLDYVWTNGNKSGIASFDGLPIGDYEIRVYYDWPKEAYRQKTHHSFSVAYEPNKNMSAEVILPDNFGWDSYDTEAVAADALEEATTGKAIEWIQRLSLDAILEKMLKEKNAIKLARLEAVYKRKFFRFMHTKGMYLTVNLPKITQKEIALLARQYKYSPTMAARVLPLVNTCKSVKLLFKDGLPAVIRKRLGKAFTAKLFTKVFGPVCTLSDLKDIYDFVIETERLKDAWEGAVKSMEQMNCADYDLFCFRSNLDATELLQIEELRQREADYFIAINIKPPIYPPWAYEVEEACLGKNTDSNISFGWVKGVWATSRGTHIEFVIEANGTATGTIIKIDDKVKERGYNLGQVVYRGWKNEFKGQGIYKHAALYGESLKPELTELARSGQYDPDSPIFKWKPNGTIWMFKDEETLNIPNWEISNNKPLTRVN